MSRFLPGRTHSSTEVDTDLTYLDDEVEIPKHGFLDKEKYSLPTYEQRKYEDGNDGPGKLWQTPLTVTFTVVDIVETIKENYQKSRLLLWETARRNKPSFAIIRRNRLKLSDGARALDEIIWMAIQSLRNSTSVTEPVNAPRDGHTRAMNDAGFKAALEKGTKTLRRLEKRLRNTVIDELTAGMIDKRDIDHPQLAIRIKKIHTEVINVCEEAMRAYAMGAGGFGFGGGYYPSLQLTKEEKDQDKDKEERE